MNLPDTIHAHAKALPPELQRQTLDFITWLEQRHARRQLAAGGETEQFLQRVAGTLGDDFPDDIGDDDLAADLPRDDWA